MKIHLTNGNEIKIIKKDVNIFHHFVGVHDTHITKKPVDDINNLIARNYKGSIVIIDEVDYIITIPIRSICYTEDTKWRK